VTAIERGCKSNTGYYVSEVLTPLSEWWREKAGGNFRHLMVHADNARDKATMSQQFMARHAMAIAFHPPYSPDRAPLDFYLFDHVKGLLRGESFESEERLLAAVEGMLKSLERSTLMKVSLEWMKRPGRCVEIDGDYVG
jgi:hypothetical protein